MNIANKLTVLRLFMIPVFVIALIHFGTGSYIPVSLFIVASLTDTLDGYLARKYQLVTTFGKFLDPLADKMLATTALIMLVEKNKISAVIVVIIVLREFIVSGLRILAASEGITIAASKWGKFKTITQFIAIILLLIDHTIFVSTGIPLDVIFVYLATILTIVSGIDYLIKNKQVLRLDNI